MYDKLEGLPPIYYLNLDNRLDRREYMESQFNKFDIKQYTRVSANRYDPNKFIEWQKSSLIMNTKNNRISYISILVNQLQSIIDWYYSEVSET